MGRRAKRRTIFNGTFSTKQFENRTRYELICERLRSVFSDEELYFGIYETMFTDSEIERLSAFLNLPVKYEHRQAI